MTATTPTPTGRASAVATPHRTATDRAVHWTYPRALAQRAMFLVAKFHLRMGLPMGPNVDGYDQVHPTSWTTRVCLTAEELTELQVAVVAEDARAITDALADLQFCISGTALVYGLDLPPAVDRVRGSRIYHSAIESYDDVLRPQNREAIADHLSEAIRRWAEAVYAVYVGSTDVLLDELAKMFVSTINLAADYGLPLAEALDEVAISNMTKKPFGDTDRKVVKGPDYVAPDLERALRNHLARESE